MVAAFPFESESALSKPVREPIRREESGIRDKVDAPGAPAAVGLEVLNRGDFEKGRLAGKAEERRKAEEERVLDEAAQKERQLLERLEFEVIEVSRIEESIAAGFARIEERTCAAVARILSQFANRWLVKTVVDDLRENLRLVHAAGASGSMKISGSARMIDLLRESVTGLFPNAEYLIDDRIEVLIEAGDLTIESQLKPWSDLLASLDV